MTFVIGIDPGLSGAIAWTQDGEHFDVADMPVFETIRNRKLKHEVDADGLAVVLAKIGPGPVIAYVELVGPMPDQGVSAVFSFGRSFGIPIGVLAALSIPRTFVAPVVWKKMVGIPAGSTKDESRKRATALLPKSCSAWPLVKHGGRAEASLIAYYGWCTEGVRRSLAPPEAPRAAPSRFAGRSA